MSLISNSATLRCAGQGRTAVSGERKIPELRPNWLGMSVPLRSTQSDPLCVACSPARHMKRSSNSLRIQMAVVDNRVARHVDVGKHFGTLAYELVQGALVRWSSLMDRSVPEPPTAVLVHGILGSRKNWAGFLLALSNEIWEYWGLYTHLVGVLLTGYYCRHELEGSFARRLAKCFPLWQFLLVDLRCHGESASIKKRPPHSVAAAALDVLKLVAQLRIMPRVLVGHSFGGKVALSMVEQAAKPLARPVKVWVLDATPGKARPGGHGEDHPAELISFLRRMPEKVPSKQYVMDALLQEGFSKEVAQWVVTNLQSRSLPGSASSFSWGFDLEGIAEMYHSYEQTNLWKVVEDVPRGVHVNFLKAERSLHRWALEDIQRIHAAEELAADEGGGVQMHVLEDAGHWVHADNPDGLFRILSASFEGIRSERSY